MPVAVLADRWLHVEKSNLKVRKRKLIGGDLLAAMSDPEEMRRQDPRHPKARILIETMQVVGENILTAQDRALYEIMLAWARKHGLDKDTHEIPGDAVKAYLGTANWADIRRSVERLSSVQVRYDFRDEEWRRTGKIALVSAGLKESLKDSAVRFVEFEIPARIRRVLVEARDYGKIELAAFPRFTSKYTAIVYQRLALRAGYDERLIRPWEMTPTELATDLGYPMRDGLKYGEFRARCLDPVLNDLAFGTTRFVVDLEEVRGTGRGRPVEKLIWRVTPAFARVDEMPMADVTRQERELLKTDGDDLHPKSVLPTAASVRRLLRHLRGALSIRELFHGWRAALDEVAAGRVDETVASPVLDVDLFGEALGHRIIAVGADEAFRTWAIGNAKTRRFVRRAPRLTVAAHAPAVEETPVVETKAERDPRYRVEFATQMLDGLRADIHPRLLLDQFDADMLHWKLCFAHLANDGRQLRSALKTADGQLRKALSATNEAYSPEAYAAALRQARSTLLNLGRAARDGNFERLSTIATAILATAPADDCPF